MEVECPRCKSNKTFKRKSVPRIETHTRKFIKGKECEVQIAEPKFYLCIECWYKFNIK